MDFVKGIFDPVKQAQAASGALGGLLGASGRGFGHLGGEFGDMGASQEAFNPKDHFDVASFFKLEDHFSPEETFKLY